MGGANIFATSNFAKIIFSIYFILLRVVEDPETIVFREHIRREAGIYPEWDTSPSQCTILTHTHTHIHSRCGQVFGRLEETRAPGRNLDGHWENSTQTETQTQEQAGSCEVMIPPSRNSLHQFVCVLLFFMEGANTS